MARKNIIEPFKLFNNVDISTNQTSDSTDIKHLDNVGIVVEWSGSSPSGEFFVECANPDPNILNESSWTWSELDFGSDIVISGNSGSHIINMTQNPFAKLRVKYTSTSGSGNLTATITAKQVGG